MWHRETSRHRNVQRHRHRHRRVVRSFLVWLMLSWCSKDSPHGVPQMQSRSPTGIVRDVSKMFSKLAEVCRVPDHCWDLTVCVVISSTHKKVTVWWPWKLSSSLESLYACLHRNKILPGKLDKLLAHCLYSNLQSFEDPRTHPHRKIKIWHAHPHRKLKTSHSKNFTCTPLSQIKNSLDVWTSYSRTASRASLELWRSTCSSPLYM